MKENLIEVAQYDGPGYRALVYYEGWRVAFLNDDPSKYRRETIPYLERHNETDELFVLLEGRSGPGLCQHHQCNDNAGKYHNHATDGHVVSCLSISGNRYG